jgi:hypothetical protein
MSHNAEDHRPETAARQFPRDLLLWIILFLICFGLGYPTLNRYDPRETGGLSDTQSYYALVTHPAEEAPSYIKFRVLVPLLARPLYLVAKGHIGTWEPVFFGLLIVNSFFVATTAYLLVRIGRLLLPTDSAALLAATIYLLDFEVSNLRLSGMLDSAEGLFLIAIVWSLLSRHYWLLPILGLSGALAKETFVPFCLVFTFVWWGISRRGERWTARETAATLSTGAVAILSAFAVQSAITGRPIWPWAFAGSMFAPTGHLQAVVENIFDRNLLYGFAWLLPVGALRLRRFPCQWTLGCATVSVLVLILVAWHGDGPGTAARALFSVSGPLLSLSAASYLAAIPVGSARPRA